ncbi:MAG: biotin-dependent carboxyltransferase family protein [Flaviramulus sp.]|nr:biotin-dependent carboxyltransferase family protein [Flaviramulus sp.]
MINVLKSGFHSIIQDFGRMGYQEFGVPYSGVMDRKAASFANALLGNDEETAVLEMTMTGGFFQFYTKTYIAISGADMSPMLNNQPIQINKLIAVNSNDILSFGKLNTGFRSYLAVLGGFKTESVLGSKSMYQNITKRFKVLKNDDLFYDEASILTDLKHASVRFDTSYLNSKYLEVFKGPEFDLLSDNQKTKLLSHSFTISKNNNRMAYQLDEAVQNDLKPIITSAVLPGTVQLTPSGNLIILMRDCQTTGGYPRIFHLKENSINVLAQKYTGQSIEFKLQ